MRIDQHEGPVGSPAEVPDGVAARPVLGGGDRVSVSQEARELARLRAEVGPVDTVRTDRVSALRAAVESGQYRPEPVAVATSVLRDILGQLLA